MQRWIIFAFMAAPFLREIARIRARFVRWKYTRDNGIVTALRRNH